MATILRHSILLALLVPVHANAGDFQSLDAIDAHAAEASGTVVRPVDRRLKLAPCPDALQTDAPGQGAVIVRCMPLGWRVRVLIVTNSMTASNAPVAIKRGDPVSVNFVAPGFSVTTSGIAETEARIGEPVRVRVEQKANPIMGEAVDAGTVRVGGLK